MEKYNASDNKPDDNSHSESFVKYVTRKGGGGSSVVLRSYLKTWLKCGKPVTIGGGGRGSKKSKEFDWLQLV